MPQPSAGTEIRPVALAAGGAIALIVAMGIGRFVYTPILPFMEADLGLSKSDGGLIASANYLGYLVGALAAAWIKLPGGVRRWFLSAIGLSILTTAAMGFTTSMAAFLLIRFLSGVASAFVLVLSSTVVLARLTDAGRQSLFSVQFAGVGMGISVSAIVVAQMASHGAEWPAFWLASGVIGVIGLIAVVVLVNSDPPIPVEVVQSSKNGSSDLSRDMWSLIISYGLFGFGYVILATFISAMVRDTPEISWLESGIWLTVGVAAIPAVAFWLWVAERWGTGFSYAAQGFTQAIGTLIATFATASTVIIGAITLGATIVGLTAVGLIHARTLTDRDPRYVLGVMTGAFGIGQIVGPIFAGIVSDYTGTLTLPLFGAAAALLGCAVLTPDLRPKRC